MTTRIEERWDKLQADPETPVFQLLEAEHPLSFYIGREITGERLFLLVDREKPPAIRSMQALQILCFRRGDGRWGILLRLMDQELAGIFALLCQDLVESSRQLPTGLSGSQFVARRLASWRLLLEQRKADVLAPSEIRGLFAELFVLWRWVATGAMLHEAVKAWVGPVGGDQDFQGPDVAWEVKSIRPDAESVLIASEKQLYSSTRGILLLVLILSDAGGEHPGFSLNDLVRNVRDQVGVDPIARSLLDERLEAAGYLVREEYNLPILAVAGHQAFEVREGFPRIIRPILPLGVADVRYAVSLTACSAYRTEWPFEM